MPSSEMPVPHLMPAYSGPLHHIEEIILNQVPLIEGWFRKQWQQTPPPITSSVDLRHAGFKLGPVDTNLFPAGFNNLNPDFLPLGIQAAQSVIMDYFPNCTHILIVPENHTRNTFYLQSLSRLRELLSKAGFIVRIGSIDPLLKSTQDRILENGEILSIEPLQRHEKRVFLSDFNPCLVLLNNDLSNGIPELLQSLQQDIQPPVELGWSTRLKTTHFQHFNQVANEFSKLIQIDPWLICPLFKAVDGLDFMSQSGMEMLAQKVDTLLQDIHQKYNEYHIPEKPFAVVKADNGTYGMSVMMVHEADELLKMNRKQRTKMSSRKGSQTVNRVIVQEGIHSVETMGNGAVAEPVIYMLGQYVIGGFYRVHQNRAWDENLNAPGMHFEPLAFAEACNTPQTGCEAENPPNRFYIYGVIARLAALAAGREIAALGE